MESIGELSVSELLLRPRFELIEQREGGFHWGESQFGVKWALDAALEAQIKVGPLALLNRQQFYNPDTDPEEWGIIEAYGAWNSPYGVFRMGLIPLDYGEEGATKEADLYFERSQLFDRGVVALRDVGFNYSILHNGFFTSITVHNGEAGEPEDRRTWYTAKWGWQDREKFRIGVAGQTGSTDPTITSLSGSTLGNVDVSKEATWRTGTVFVKWFPSDFKMLFEAHLGEVKQESRLKEKYAGGHLDLMWDFSKHWGIQTRYDHFDENTKQDRDSTRIYSIGFSLTNTTQTSRLFLIGSKVFEEGLKTPNDQVVLIWRLTPLTPIKK